MSEYSLKHFIDSKKQNDAEQDYFELETPQMLEINLNNQFVWTKNGSMVGYVDQRILIWSAGNYCRILRISRWMFLH